MTTQRLLTMPKQRCTASSLHNTLSEDDVHMNDEDDDDGMIRIPIRQEVYEMKAKFFPV